MKLGKGDELSMKFLQMPANFKWIEEFIIMVALIIGWTSEIRCAATKNGMEGLDMWNGRGQKNHGYGLLFLDMMTIWKSWKLDISCENNLTSSLNKRRCS